MVGLFGHTWTSSFGDNPTNVRFDVGKGGGRPELTAQDVAAALALIPAGLGREVLIACWWSEVHSGERLMAYVRESMFAEWRRQRLQLVDSQTDLKIAQACLGWSGSATPAQEEAVQRAQHRADAAQARCWPDSMPELLPAMARAALTEIAYPHHCPACCGHKQTTKDQLVVVCQTCEGAGTVPVSDRARAGSLGVSDSTYRRSWRLCYEFLLIKVRDAEAAAASALGGVLKRAS
ncbi:hypothetical protein [Pseudoxanthomonas sp. UTMC 1351]|uniref:hypothetical protein n=1 Tax=Pseudoxanthomonas sp. UTMC 1351 TaxID=2695853 RepID=UPI0034CDD6B7